MTSTYVPDTNWATITSASAALVAFRDLIFNLNLTQLVLQPTQSHGIILNLVITNDVKLISHLIVQSQPPLLVDTDHFIISLDILLINRLESIMLQICSLCFLAFLQFSAYYAYFYAF